MIIEFGNGGKIDHPGFMCLQMENGSNLQYISAESIHQMIFSGRIAEVRSRSMSCNCMTRTSQQECRGILELLSPTLYLY